MTPDSVSHCAEANSCIENPGTDKLKDVGGLEAIKEDLSMLVHVLRNPKLFHITKLAPPSRLLFTGSPGTGKTMLAKALASEVGATFMMVTLSTLEDKYFGETPKILRSVFETAQKISSEKPVILFFDEIDGIMRRRRDDDQSHVYGLKTEFLQNMDSLKGSVVVIGCTNCASSLDPALRRRLPDTYDFPLPDESQRMDILKKITRNDSVRDTTLLQVAKATDGASGSDLRQRYRRACLMRSKRIIPKVHRDASIEQITRMIPRLTISDWVK